MTLPRRAFALLCHALAVFALSSTLCAADAASLPLTSQFGKGTPGENGGPYALTVTNTSDHNLQLSGVIHWSVTSHNRAQTQKLGPKTLAAGESWTINDLAVEDRVVLEADGYATLELKTPPGKAKVPHLPDGY